MDNEPGTDTTSKYVVAIWTRKCGKNLEPECVEPISSSKLVIREEKIGGSIICMAKENKKMVLWEGYIHSFHGMSSRI